TLRVIQRMTMQTPVAGVSEFDYWQEAIADELPEKEREAFSARMRGVMESGKVVPHSCARLILWLFESKPYGLKHLRSVRKDKELMSFCEDVVSLCRREISGEVVAPELF